MMKVNGDNRDNCKTCDKIICEEESYIKEAKALAEHLGVPLEYGPPGHDRTAENCRTAGHDRSEECGPPGRHRPAESGGAVLRFGRQGLCLEAGGQSLRGDFTKLLPRLRPSALGRETLVRAARFRRTGGRSETCSETGDLAASAPGKPAEGDCRRSMFPQLTAVDATAGLGEDSLLLAAAGFHVQLCEYNPVIAALLRDALRRAAEIPELEEITGRMRLTEGDSRVLLRGLEEPPDLVLLDPMFPERRKNALSKKKLQLLQRLEQPCEDESGLLRAALDAGPRKIVIKRPVRGDFLAGRRPGYSITGKLIRYDCLVLPEHERMNRGECNHVEHE
ncbi:MULTISPECIES: class I SAM-dependent methyltransferase [Hornefia]|uniref:class I SAM-dependent methyltransferase n=1 Tax=Hornefia TaxID=2815774 RepID=UPI001FE98587|nr:MULTISPECIES: class I SAM-dependent methyltransferase [Hornefia]MCI7413768.1 class I SAM-dependent methyltransferase [Clostridiales bacterium]MDY6211254.1 class I SAM-dependent methyltransferase [Hornefia butyriciproducens]